MSFEKKVENNQCSICLKKFNHQPNYWRHVNASKRPCITKKRLEVLMEDHRDKDIKIKALERKIVLMKKQLNEKGNTQQQSQQQHIVNGDMIINQGTINNTIVNNNNYNIILTLPGEEKIDHIGREDLKKILDEEYFSDVLKRIAEQVFFHPAVPENMKWCVFDKNAENGVLNFNHIDNSISKVNTNDTINEHVQNLVSGLLIQFGKLNDENQLNSRQRHNYNKLGHLMGSELDDHQLIDVKDVAHQKQDYPKSLWVSLKLLLIDEFKSKSKY